MPLITPDQLQQKAVALKKKLAEKAAKLNGPALRAMKKRIRRVQRKRRRLVRFAAKAAGATSEKKD